MCNKESKVPPGAVTEARCLLQEMGTRVRGHVLASLTIGGQSGEFLPKYLSVFKCVFICTSVKHTMYMQ